jgi:hypothetical protein
MINLRIKCVDTYGPEGGGSALVGRAVVMLLLAAAAMKESGLPSDPGCSCLHPIAIPTSIATKGDSGIMLPGKNAIQARLLRGGGRSFWRSDNDRAHCTPPELPVCIRPDGSFANSCPPQHFCCAVRGRLHAAQ